MSSVTGVVVTLNDEDVIEGCLESIDWCDEIIVVDSYSDDKTTEIADRYAAKLHFETDVVRSYFCFSTTNSVLSRVSHPSPCSVEPLLASQHFV